MIGSEPEQNTFLFTIAIDDLAEKFGLFWLSIQKCHVFAPWPSNYLH